MSVKFDSKCLITLQLLDPCSPISNSDIVQRFSNFFLANDNDLYFAKVRIECAGQNGREVVAGNSSFSTSSSSRCRKILRVSFAC